MIKPRGINHIGIAVRSIEGHRAFYERTLGARFDGIEEVPSQHVRVASFVVGSPGHETRLELIEATAPEAAVAAFVEQRGEGLHHIAYDVDDLDKQLLAFKAEGVRLADEVPREGSRRTRIAFLHPKSTGGVLTELCEMRDDLKRRGF